jgi:uncharacterized protein (TIGR02246 family)
MTEDERAIREVIATWMRASAEGDTETVLGLMADDVVFFVPGRAFGKEEFAAAQQGLAGARLEAVSNVREVRVSGDWAFCSTDLSIVMTPAGGGEPVRRSGNTLSVFQRLPDGRWVLARDANLLAVR